MMATLRAGGDACSGKSVVASFWPSLLLPTALNVQASTWPWSGTEHVHRCSKTFEELQATHFLGITPRFFKEKFTPQR